MSNSAAPLLAVLKRNHMDEARLKISDYSSSVSPELRRLLALYPRLLHPVAAPESLGGAGGLSGSRLWRYESGRGTLVLRAWPPPPDGPRRERLEQVHRWQAEAATLGLVAVPLAGLDGRTIQEYDGRLWEICPWMPGEGATASLRDPARLRFAVGGLAALHQALAHHATRGTSPGLLRRLREIEHWTETEFDRFARVLAACEHDSHAGLAQHWLVEARSLAPRVAETVRQFVGKVVRLQPCLRDVRPEHFLFERDQLTAIIDFGAMDIDTVAGDLARLLLEWLGLTPDPAVRAETLAAYEAIRPLEPLEIALIDAFTSTSALLLGGHWARWHFLEHRPFENKQAVRQGLETGVRLVEGLAATVPGLPRG